MPADNELSEINWVMVGARQVGVVFSEQNEPSSDLPRPYDTDIPDYFLNLHNSQANSPSRLKADSILT
jgi:hypothetical protein